MVTPLGHGCILHNYLEPLGVIKYRRDGSGKAAPEHLTPHPARCPRTQYVAVSIPCGSLLSVSQQ